MFKSVSDSVYNTDPPPPPPPKEQKEPESWPPSLPRVSSFTQDVVIMNGHMNHGPRPNNTNGGGGGSHGGVPIPMSIALRNQFVPSNNDSDDNGDNDDSDSFTKRGRRRPRGRSMLLFGGQKPKSTVLEIVVVTKNHHQSHQKKDEDQQQEEVVLHRSVHVPALHPLWSDLDNAQPVCATSVVTPDDHDDLQHLYYGKENCEVEERRMSLPLQQHQACRFRGPLEEGLLFDDAESYRDMKLRISAVVYSRRRKQSKQHEQTLDKVKANGFHEKEGKDDVDDEEDEHDSHDCLSEYDEDEDSEVWNDSSSTDSDSREQPPIPQLIPLAELPLHPDRLRRLPLPPAGGGETTTRMVLSPPPTPNHASSSEGRRGDEKGAALSKSLPSSPQKTLQSPPHLTSSSSSPPPPPPHRRSSSHGNTRRPPSSLASSLSRLTSLPPNAVLVEYTDGSTRVAPPLYDVLLQRDVVIFRGTGSGSRRASMDDKDVTTAASSSYHEDKDPSNQENQQQETPNEAETEEEEDVHVQYRTYYELERARIAKRFSEEAFDALGRIGVATEERAAAAVDALCGDPRLHVDIVEEKGGCCSNNNDVPPPVNKSISFPPLLDGGGEDDGESVEISRNGSPILLGPPASTCASFSMPLTPSRSWMEVGSMPPPPSLPSTPTAGSPVKKTATAEDFPVEKAQVEISAEAEKRKQAMMLAAEEKEERRQALLRKLRSQIAQQEELLATYKNHRDKHNRCAKASHYENSTTTPVYENGHHGTPHHDDDTFPKYDTVHQHENHKHNMGQACQDEARRIQFLMEDVQTLQEERAIINHLAQDESAKLGRTEFIVMARQAKLLQELRRIYPIHYVSSARCFAIRGLLVPPSPLSMLTAEEGADSAVSLSSAVFASLDDPTVASAMGFVCHLVFMCSKYLQISLRYKLICNSSRSAVAMTCAGTAASSPTALAAAAALGDMAKWNGVGGTAANTNTYVSGGCVVVVYPLYRDRNKSMVDRTRDFDRALVLLDRNIECLCKKRGVVFRPGCHMLAKLDRLLDQTIRGAQGSDGVVSRSGTG